MSNVKILILEDHALTSTALAKMLNNAGYEVVGRATTGEKGVQLFREYNPDIVILDIRLAGPMNGIEAGKIMAAMGRTPIIYVSGFLEEYFNETLPTGPFAVFSKPYNEGDLQRTIELAIHRYAENVEPQLSQNEPNKVFLPGLILPGDCFWIKDRERYDKKLCQDVRYFKASNVYVEVHNIFKRQPIILTLGLSKLVEALEGRPFYDCFIAVSRSYIVNVDHVTSCTKNFDSLTMDDETIISVSEGYRAIVRDRLGRLRN